MAVATLARTKQRITVDAEEIPNGRDNQYGNHPFQGWDILATHGEPCATGWRLVKDFDANGLGLKIHEAGWTFFRLAGEIKATIFGFEEQRNVRRAVKRILTNLKSEKFNG
ncbi:MAG: hypothetical protein WB630_09725, partial [Candidatus Acidiferrales bacterium]